MMPDGHQSAPTNPHPHFTKMELFLDSNFSSSSILIYLLNFFFCSGACEIMNTLIHRRKITGMDLVRDLVTALKRLRFFQFSMEMEKFQQIDFQIKISLFNVSLIRQVACAQ